MRNGDPSLTRSISVAARALTAAVVLLPPSIYFVTSYQHEVGVLEAEAEINARLVNRIVSANPDLWQYEQVRMLEYLTRRPGTGEGERRRVLDARGRVVAESADPLPAPWLTESEPLLDSGVQVGTLEVSRSLQPLLLRSAVLALVLLAAGAASYRAVRTVPLRLIRRSQEELRRERDAAQRYLDVAGVAFLIVDEGGRVARVNRKGCEILGRPEGEVLGREWVSTFVDPADRPRVAAESAARRRTDDVVPLEYSVIRPDGERRVVSWYLTSLSDDEGSRTGVLASGVDITVQAQLEEQLRRAQKLEAIGRLASGVAHDFNNVLSVIKGKAVLLRRKLEEQDPRGRYLDDILASVDRAASLTGNLLTFGRREVQRPEAMDLVEFLRRFERSLRGLLREGVELRLALPPDPLPVMAEPLQLERVLMNLVTNAQDAMPGGGRVEVSASRTTLDARGAAGAGLEGPGPYAELSVADTGTGIPPEAQASIFEPFFTTKDVGKGTGLGLSISYAIAKQHHGTIRVASAAGKGSTFTVVLPLAEPRPGTSAPAPNGAASAEPRAQG